MSKVDKERKILKLSEKLLEDLYGKYTIDENQIDKPDAAIILKSGAKIGIEITTVDKQDALRYFNDKYDEKEHLNKQINDLIKDKSYSKRPMKSKSIKLENHYVYSGLMNKKDKYKEYLKSDDYDELIILAFSSFIKLKNPFYKSYHIPWTNHLLSKVKFPFNKVILVCTETGSADLVYDKNKPKLNSPKMEKNKEEGITQTQGPILPFGENINLGEIMNNAPLVKERKKSNKNKKCKKKRN